MPSSRASSSSPASSPSGTPLTLKSNARTLAMVDSTDEGEPRQPNSAQLPSSPVSGQPKNQVDSNDEDEDEDEDIRPRGRLASRMLAQTHVSAESSPEQLGDARERVRRMFQRQDEEAEQAKQAQRTITEEPAEHDEAEDDLPTVPRRLKQRKARSTTPDDKSPRPEPGSASSGLFVSLDRPQHQAPRDESDVDGSDDSLPDLYNTNRFQKLVEKKRQERLAREAEEERKREERGARLHELTDQLGDEEGGNASDITDDEGGRRLTQTHRPARKAGKKAMEDMNRETQRLARNMQLAHEAKTRKKISKASLLERFNFRPQGGIPPPPPQQSSSSRPATPNSAHHTDVEMQDHDTPPTSPPVEKGDNAANKANFSETTIQQARPAEKPPKLDKGKGKAVDFELDEEKPRKMAKPKRNIRVKFSTTQVNMGMIDLDDDLEIVDPKKSKLDAIFDKVPQSVAEESRSMRALRRLALMTSPGKDPRKKDDKAAMSASDLQAMLQQRARAQARAERERRLEILRSKGIVIQTEEERERQMEEVDDIVARARQEAEEIMQRERDAAKEEKKAKKENGETDALDWDESDDEEYAGSASENGDVDDVEIELSGSDEEEEEEEDEEAGGNGLVDDVAEENDDSEASEQEEDNDALDKEPADSMDEVEDNLPAKAIRRAKTKVVVLSDEEDEDDGAMKATPKPKDSAFKSPSLLRTDSPAVPTSVLRSATKPFIPGIPVVGPVGMGLTQVFAGTMDDSQSMPATGAPPESPMPIFSGFPVVALPDTQLETQPDDGVDMVVDSQMGGDTQLATQDASHAVRLHFTQTQMFGPESMLRQEMSQLSDLAPTQPSELQEYTPLKERFIAAPQSTIDTVIINQDDDTVDSPRHDSPLIRRGILRRRVDADVARNSTDDVEGSHLPDTAEQVMAEEDEFGFNTTSAFGVLQAAAAREQRKAVKEFKKKSKAKEMVDEQAEESEDEYAGLGGVDGEDSEDEDAASIKDMIEDADIEVDEGKIAAFYADRERADDEKQVDKLFRDITTGMLRRKRGADYDLSDSDDGGEARRRMKRRQFAKMQKALFADERIKKIAENPGNQAFLRTIEDRASDDEDMGMDILEFGGSNEATTGTEDESQGAGDQVVPDSQPEEAHQGRQPLGQGGDVVGATNRLPAAQRRTKDGKRPSNISEIRESLSTLLDEPHATVIPSTDPGSGSDSDGEDAARPGTSSSNKENHPRRSRQNPSHAKPAIVDRLTLKRQSSSTLSTGSGTSAATRLAYAAPSASTAGFKVPGLLRRATTNSLLSNSSASSTSTSSNKENRTTGSGFGGDSGKIKKTAGKRSGVNYFARENERRAAMAERETRREAKKWKGAEKRVKAVGGLFGVGKFE